MCSMAGPSVFTPAPRPAMAGGWPGSRNARRGLARPPRTRRSCRSFLPAIVPPDEADGYPAADSTNPPEPAGPACLAAGSPPRVIAPPGGRHRGVLILQPAGGSTGRASVVAQGVNELVLAHR